MALSYVLCKLMGTSDQSCWLAEACKVLLLLLLLLVQCQARLEVSTVRACQLSENLQTDCTGTGVL